LFNSTKNGLFWESFANQEVVKASQTNMAQSHKTFDIADDHKPNKMAPRCYELGLIFVPDSSYRQKYSVLMTFA